MFDTEGKALIVEDNPDTRAWLVNCVRDAFPDLEVDAVDNLQQGLSRIRSALYQLALVDLGLPDGNGTELIKEMRSRNPDCHIVVATIYDDDRNLFSALKAGARGYILKDQDKDRIVGYLQGIKHNRPAISAESSQRLIEHFNSKGSNLASSNLTPREMEVISLVAKGCSVDETASLLSLSADTVKGYIKSIHAKLDVSNRAELTLAAVNLGLISD